MIEARRRAYLEAMDLDIWVSRSVPGASAASTGLLQLGPGGGSTLVVCTEAADSAGRFAGDLARALGDEPLWAWPDPSGSGDGLPAVVDSRLITRVIVLGDSAVRWLFPDGAPATVGSAAVTAVAGMEELAVSAEAKQGLWQSLRLGLAPSRGRA